MPQTSEPYSLEDRPGSSAGTATLAVVYTHAASAPNGQYAKHDVYVVTDVTTERREGIEKTLRVIARIGNEGFQNGWNLREFQYQLDSVMGNSMQQLVIQ